jgi:hypothetical protein
MSARVFIGLRLRPAASVALAALSPPPPLCLGPDVISVSECVCKAHVHAVVRVCVRAAGVWLMCSCEQRETRTVAAHPSLQRRQPLGGQTVPWDVDLRREREHAAPRSLWEERGAPCKAHAAAWRARSHPNAREPIDRRTQLVSWLPALVTMGRESRVVHVGAMQAH